MSESLINKAKAEHSRNAVFYFCLFGIILFLASGKSLLSLRVLAFFVVGMFAASLLSVPSYLVKMVVARRLTIDKAFKYRLVYSAGETAYDLAVTWALFHIFISRFY